MISPRTTLASAADNASSPSPSGALRPGDSYVQSFARGLSVISTFCEQHPEQTLSDVAARTGLTRAGARRILLTLQTLGYVQCEGRLFRLTPKILGLGFAYLSSQPLWNHAEPLMESLVQDIRESCSAAVLDGTDIVYVMRVPTHKIMSINLGIGSRLPAYCTSMGRVLLSGLPDEQLDVVLGATPPERHTPRTVTSITELRKIVLKVRAQGWCLVNQELEEGLVSVAVPVRDRNRRVIAAMNVSGQVNRTSAQQMTRRILPALQATALAVSALLQR